MDRRSLILGGGSLFLAGCASRWVTDYENGLSPSVSREWRLSGVSVRVPEELKVSNSNTLAPNAAIVWHGEPFGDRKAQVEAIMSEAIAQGAKNLNGTRPVTIGATVAQFHAVTPAAVGRSPAAVHNISYAIQVFDSRTAAPITEEDYIQADFEAYTGAAAVAAAVQGNTQRVRIVDHVARVTAGWLGIGPDQRRSFTSIGR